MAAQPPSEVFRHRLRDVRRALGGISQAELSERLQKLGLDLSPTAIARIETGDRAVKLDEVVGIAAALNVSPLALMLPADRTAEVAVTPTVAIAAYKAARWAAGGQPLDATTVEAFDAYANHAPHLTEELGFSLEDAPVEVRRTIVERWIRNAKRLGLPFAEREEEHIEKMVEHLGPGGPMALDHKILTIEDDEGKEETR